MKLAFCIIAIAIVLASFLALEQWKAKNDQAAADRWEKYVTEHSMQELHRLLALDRQQVIAGCRFVSAGKDGDYIITLHPEDSYVYVLGSVTVSPKGEVLSNSLPQNLTFNQLMQLTREAKNWQEEGRRVCGEDKEAQR